jgi:hypothetical protein
MFVYDVPPDPPAGWAVQCANPVALLSEDVLREGLGEAQLRAVAVDCNQSWLVPPGNGWYVRPGWYEGWTAGLLAEARLAYEQTEPAFLPPFAVYEWFGQDPPAAAMPAPVYAAPTAWTLARAREGQPVEAPIAVGPDLVFVGLHPPEAETTALPQEMTTVWRVVNPPAQPISLMAHLTGDDGRVLAVGDGLGVPVQQLQPGDVVLQRHPFDLPPEAPPGPLWLQVGAYTQLDVERLPIGSPAVAGSDRLVIGPLERTP